MLRILMVLLMVGVFSSEALARSAGTVVLSVGENHADNLYGTLRPLKRGTKIYSEERIVTGPRGRVHIRFNDGSSVNLKPGSTFQIAQYHYDEAAPEEGAAVFQLLRGGLRTISGKIGKANPENVRLQTVLATIGIRGTEYELYVCDRCCAEQNGSFEGMAGGVDQGGISVDSLAGQADLKPGKYFELAKGANELSLLDERPAMLAIGDPVVPKPAPVPEPEPSPIVDECDEGRDYDPMNIWFECNYEIIGR
ncbi:MAG: FecR family protein [Pontibacterium sp.]